MDHLEKLIKEHRKLFDVHEPPAGHFKRFRKSIYEQFKKTPKTFILSSHPIFSIAAVLIILILSSILIYNYFNKDTQPISPSEISLSDISPDMQEVEFYFISQINDRMDEINIVKLKNDGLTKEILLMEFQKMDEMYNDLQKELVVNYKDERIINAMIDYYAKKIEVLDMILEQLYKVKHDTTMQKVEKIY